MQERVTRRRSPEGSDKYRHAQNQAQDTQRAVGTRRPPNKFSRCTA